MKDRDIQLVLKKLQKPSRYLGNEINSVSKDPLKVKLRFALVFPDLYEIGTSHFGIQILYHLLNSKPEIFAERVYSPARDLMKIFENTGREISSLETGTRLRNFDIVGFSLLYELNYTNILHILRFSKIPFKSSQRKNSDPIIIAGGPCTSNPEPLADFFDAMVIGDGELVVMELAKRYLLWKKRGSKNKLDLLENWAGLDGVYIPAFYKVYYKNGLQHTEAKNGYPKVIRRSVVPLLGENNFPDAPIVPYGRPVHDRLRLEISRGCSRGCRFCQAGIIYRPVRERKPSQLVNLAIKALEKTGYEDISLLSLSTGDYTCLYDLIESLITYGEKNQTAISLPSIRAGTLSLELMKMIKKIRKTGFTIAPEAGSQRLRDVINKNITFDDIQKTVVQAFELGWRVIKLYFMIGLPTENDDDIKAIIDMVKEVKRTLPKRSRGGKINVSVATFIPKPHTPFQWQAQIGLKESAEKINMLRDSLRGRRVQLKWQKPEMSFLEGLWARGDRGFSKLLIEAVKIGCVFDGWSDSFDFEKWKAAIRTSGIDAGCYVERERALDEKLPWEHIDVGVNKEFLLEELEKAEAGIKTADCRWDGCQECGVCDFKKIKPVLHNEIDQADQKNSKAEKLTKENFSKKWVMLRFKKLNLARFLGHLELSQLIIRAIRRAGINLVYGKGFHPMPKIRFEDALPLGMESLDEILYIMIKAENDATDITSKINKELPEGIEVTSSKKIDNPQKYKSKAYVYKITLDKGVFEDFEITRFIRSKKWEIEKKNKKGLTRKIDLKNFVDNIEMESKNTILMTLVNKNGTKIRPEEVLTSIFKNMAEDIKKADIIKTRTRIL